MGKITFEERVYDTPLNFVRALTCAVKAEAEVGFLYVNLICETCDVFMYEQV